MRDLFTLIIALREPKIKFVCRRLRIREEQLERKLLRLRSLVRISHPNVTTYHLSLHDFFLDKKRAGKYFIHPIRVTFVRLPKIMREVRGVLVELSLFLMVKPQFLGPWAFAALILKSTRRTRNLYVTPGILVFFVFQSAVMNYLTFVIGLPAYLGMMYSLASLAFCIENASWDCRLTHQGFASALLVITWSSSHITALYLTYQLVFPPSRA